MSRIFIPKTGYEWPSVSHMFENWGWVVTHDPSDIDKGIDLACFTGGSDINPQLYDQSINGAWGIDYERDEIEVDHYRRLRSNDIPLVGICRGAQFLHALGGGSLIQDISPRNSGDVEIILNGESEPQTVVVDHHQVMINIADKFDVLAIQLDRSIPQVIYKPGIHLAVQFHPEWSERGASLFFTLISKYCFNRS